MPYPGSIGEFPLPPLSGGGGVGYARQKAAAKEQAEKAEWEALEKDQAKAEPDQEKPAQSEVRISDLAWESENGRINEVIQVSANAELPPGMEHLTRFAFTLFSISGNSKERIDGKDAHWKNGAVSAEFTLYQPSQSSPKQPGHYEFIFSVKHKNSKEVLSKALPALLEFDEQFQLIDEATSQPLADFPYFIELKGKRLAAGRTDSEGKTPRVSTQEKRETLSVLWGDTALAKEDY